MAYFDPQTRLYKPGLYTWDSLVLETWDSALTWEDYTGSYTSSVGVPDLTYTTDIIDFGRVTWVNPLCSVQSSGTHVIKVYAAESIDSSSALPGDPVIDTSDSTARIDGVYGRYFQFVVEVFDGADSYIRSIQTDITAEEQSESISGDSATHGGSISQRIAPITKEYSRLTAVTGNAVATDNKIPLITVGALTEPTQPRYKVYNIIDVEPGDSSTVIGIKDLINNTTITTLAGTPHTDERTAVWDSPVASIGFNTVTPDSVGQYYGEGAFATDTDDSISISMTGLGLGTGDWTIQGWHKVWASNGYSETDPGYAHPNYFLELLNSSNEGVRFRTTTDAGTLEFEYEFDNSGTWNSLGYGGGRADYDGEFQEGKWQFWRIRRSGNTLYVAFSGDATTVSETSKATSISGYDLSNVGDAWTLKLGDLGSTDPAVLWLNDVKISTDNDSTANKPTAEFVTDSNDVFYMNGVSQYPILDIPARVSLTDAEVNLVIRGLPKMIVNAQGNIVEQ